MTFAPDWRGRNALEVPHFFWHETGRTPANKGRSGDFHFALSENPAAGTLARFRAGG